MVLKAKIALYDGVDIKGSRINKTINLKFVALNDESISDTARRRVQLES